MTIPLIEEPKKSREAFGMLERCFFCLQKTITWHENTNNPVCYECSKLHKVSELPDFGHTIRKRKYPREKDNV
jgi:hypothetical protein